MTLDDLYNRYANENILYGVLIELTYRCNLDCAICYNDRDLMGRPLSFGDYERLLIDLRGMNVVSVALSGGEPLAHPDFFGIGTKARDLGFVIRIKSNGHALRSSLLTRIKTEIDPYCIEVSIHGADADTHDRQTRVPGSFKRLMENLHEMRSLHLRIRLNTPITRWNAHQVERLMDIAEVFQATQGMDFNLTPRDNGDISPLALGASPDEIIEAKEVIKRRLEDRGRLQPAPTEQPTHTPRNKHCAAGSTTLTIDPYGNIYPCVQFRTTAGNLHERSVQDIWTGSEVLDEVRDTTIEVKRWMETLGPAGQSMGFCPGIARFRTEKATNLYPVANLMKEIAERVNE